MDAATKNALNAPGDFSGTIEHRENIGKTSDDLVVLWNAGHPDDSVSYGVNVRCFRPRVYGRVAYLVDVWSQFIRQLAVELSDLYQTANLPEIDKEGVADKLTPHPRRLIELVATV